MKDILNNYIIKYITYISKSIKPLQEKIINYWFRTPSAISFKSNEFLLSLSLFFLIFLLGFGTLIYNYFFVGKYPPKNKLLQPAGIGMICLGIGGIVFSFIRSQGINFLGSRIFLLVLFLASVCWLFYYLFSYKSKFYKEAVSFEAKELKKKYLSKH